MYKKIIWATDGSVASDLALGEARRLARANAGRIVAVHGDERVAGRALPYPALADEDEMFAKIRRQVEQLRRRGVDIELVVRQSHGHLADTVASIADELGGEVIVCGRGGRGAHANAPVGSFVHRLLRVARCPVLAVPRVEAPSRTETRRRQAIRA